MNREEIIAGLIGNADITFGTAKSTTAIGAMEEIEKAQKTTCNIENLIERLTAAKEADIKLSITPTHTNNDYHIHTTDQPGNIELVIIFGYRLEKMIGSGPDPIEALRVAHAQATARVTELQQHLEWLQEDINAELNKDQRDRLTRAMIDIGRSEYTKQTQKIMSNWMKIAYDNGIAWDHVIHATMQTPGIEPTQFMMGYMAHVFITEAQKEDDSDGT